MEQHPVPQNVTTFQFRLIGDMTLKQFGYLVGGAIVAYILYKLPLPLFFTLPLSIFSAILGFGLAFVPIEERPMDFLVLSYIKSMYNPTQFVWKKQTAAEPAPTPTPVPKPSAQAPAPTRKGDILQNIFIPASTREDASSTRGGPVVLTMSAPKKGMFDRFSNLMTPKPKTVTPAAMSGTVPATHMDFSPPPIVRPSPSVALELAETQQKESALEDKLKKLTSELEQKSGAESRVMELQSQLTDLLAQQEKMMAELNKLRSLQSPPEYNPPATTVTQTPKTPTIQVIAPGRAATVGLPRLTTFPNIVTGIA